MPLLDVCVHAKETGNERERARERERERELAWVWVRLCVRPKAFVLWCYTSDLVCVVGHEIEPKTSNKHA